VAAVDDDRPVDGRTARAMRTRQVIVDACITLIDEGDLSPTAPRVAERAGVSVRSVFQHFDDLEGLYSAVGDRVLERLVGLVLRVDPELPLERRLTLVVRQRAMLLEALTPIRRAAFINAWNSAEVTHRMRAGQAFLRAELSAAFAGEIAAAGDGGADLLIALDTLLSWASWDHLRTTVALPHDDAVEVVERMARAVLAAARVG
jgi:TetR/AcrR family transcriptional regulator, regulator of autoinduction and epiphytic fitness